MAADTVIGGADLCAFSYDAVVSRGFPTQLAVVAAGAFILGVAAGFGVGLLQRRPASPYWELLQSERQANADVE